MVLTKKPPLIVTIGTALLLTGGGVLAYWGTQWRLARLQALPAGVRAVPEAAIAAVSLSTQPEHWQRLRQFGTPETQRDFDQQLAQWRDRWITQYGLSFSQDIQPWIGAEITLAWLPAADSAPVAPAPSEERAPWVNSHRILLLPIDDPDAAQAIAERLPDPEAAPLDYRGITLHRYEAPTAASSSPLWLGRLGTQLILVAETETAARAAIDAYRGGPSLANVSDYRRALEQTGLTRFLGRVYVNVPVAVQLLNQTSQPPLPPPLLEHFQDSRGLVATLALASQGLQIRSLSWLGGERDRTYPDTNQVPQLSQYLPQETLLMASGAHFQQFWQDLSQHQTWGTLMVTPDTLALALQNSTGLTVETDLLPWMAGEFAIALVPPPSADPSQETSTLPNPSLIALAQVSDRTAAEQTFARLDQVMAQRYRFTVAPESVESIDLVKWTSPFESLTLSRGWLTNTIAFLTVGTKTETAILPPPQRSLATAPLFQLTTGDAPRLNNGHFYVNLNALKQTQNVLFWPSIPVEEQGALQAIEAIGVTATIVDPQRLQYDLFVALTRGHRPGPLPRPQPAE